MSSRRVVCWLSLPALLLFGAASPPPNGPCSGPRFQRLSEGSYQVTLDGRCPEPHDLPGLHLVPAYAGDEVTGMKALVRQGSEAASAGLKDGDVLLRLNGLPLTSPERTLEAYGRLRTQARAELVLRRSDATVTLRYRLVRTPR